jgi:hypothetical protein
MNKCYVYIFIDHNTGNPVYVGKGTRDRDSQHLRNAKNGINTHLYNWMRKYKECNNIWPKPFRVKEGLSEEEAFFMEKELISRYGRRDISTGYLFNHTDGGEGLRGRIPWNKGIPCSQETKEKISNVLKGNPKLKNSKRFSIEARAKMSLSQKGRVISEEHRKKIGNALRGKKRTIEQRQKFSDAHKGYKLPENVKAKISFSMLNNKNAAKKKAFINPVVQ